MRIVSLLPSATEIVCAVGLREQLVGVTHECDFPPSVVDLPKVTRTHIPVDAGSGEIDRLVRAQREGGNALYTLDFETMQTLAPDLIVTQTLCDVCAVDDYEVREFVKKTTVRSGPAPRVVYLEPTRLEDVLASIQTVADAAGTPERGRSCIINLRQRIERVRATARDAASNASRGSHGRGERMHVKPGLASDSAAGRRRVVVLEWLDPLFSSGHWTPDLVSIAGAVEPLARAGERSRQITLDELLAADPDVLLIACCGFTVERTLPDARAFLAQPVVGKLRCVRDRRVFIVDGSAYFSRPGPRLVDSLEIVAYLLDPSRFELAEGTPEPLRYPNPEP